MGPNESFRWSSITKEKLLQVRAGQLKKTSEVEVRFSTDELGDDHLKDQWAVLLTVDGIQVSPRAKGVYREFMIVCRLDVAERQELRKSLGQSFSGVRSFWFHNGTLGNKSEHFQHAGGVKLMRGQILFVSIEHIGITMPAPKRPKRWGNVAKNLFWSLCGIKPSDKHFLLPHQKWTAKLKITERENSQPKNGLAQGQLRTWHQVYGNAGTTPQNAKRILTILGG